LGVAGVTKALDARSRSLAPDLRRTAWRGSLGRISEDPWSGVWGDIWSVYRGMWPRWLWVIPDPMMSSIIREGEWPWD